MNKYNTKTSARSNWLSVAVAAVLTISSATAFAAAADGKVNQVEVGPNALLVQMAGVNYVAQTATQAGCTANNQSLETIKMYVSTFQSALLAGKPVRIFFTTCNGANYISGMDLNL